MTAPLLTLKDVTLSFGGTPLLQGVTFSLQDRTKACLVGRNGSGKSTLLKVIASFLEPDSGDLFVRPQASVAYLPQSPNFSGVSSLIDYVQQGLPEPEKEELFRCEAALASVGLGVDQSVQTLSGGEARRADLARALVGDPDLLLLDEPTNHLDIETILWLEDFLATFNKAVLVISHDRAFLKKVTHKTLWLDRGTVRELEKGFSAFEEWSSGILEQEERERDKRAKKIEEETRWSHQGITARRKRNQGRLRRLYALRQEHQFKNRSERSLKLQVAEGDISGRVVIEAHKISKSFGDRDIVKDFSARILRGERIGVVGPNGAGKSTLLKLLSGQLKPDKGKVKLGTNLTPLYIDQNRQALDLEKTLWETLCDKGGDQILVQGNPRHVVGYLKDFLFSPNQARSPVSSLSGGERNRLLLAKELAKASNLLILDEPTNDLDVESLDLLEEVLSDYTGTLFLVSHDRDFLDRLVTSTLFFDGGGRITAYAGGYSDAIAQKKRCDSGGPKRDPGDPKKEVRGSESSKTEVSQKEGSRRERSQSLPSRLSYKESWRLERLPGEIQVVETQLSQVKKDLSSPTLYQQDPQRFDRLSTQLNNLQEKLEELESEWLLLEEKRDALS